MEIRAVGVSIRVVNIFEGRNWEGRGWMKIQVTGIIAIRVVDISGCRDETTYYFVNRRQVRRSLVLLSSSRVP